MKVFEKVFQEEFDILKKHYWIIFDHGITVDVWGDSEYLIGNTYRISADSGYSSFDDNQIVFECSASDIIEIMIDIKKVDLDSYFDRIRVLG